MSLQDITNKILTEAQAEVDKIISAGQEETAKVVKQKEEEATAAVEAINKKEEEKAKKLKERAGFQARMIEKKAILKVKQDLINQVFKEAKDELSRLSEDDFYKLITNMLAGTSPLSQAEVITRDDRKNLINRALKEAGLSYKISKKELSPDEDGFIVSSDEIEVNNTIASLLNSRKEELEAEVVKILFG